MNLRGAKPVTDKSVRKFIEQQSPAPALYDQTIQKRFSNKFYRWIASSKNNKIEGLEKYTSHTLVAGTAQAFDHFYWKHKNRRFRFFKGEFMYHSAVLKHGGTWKFLDDLEIEGNDAVIISVPFSDFGSQRVEMEQVFAMCNSLGIPVLLDFAYYPCTKNIKIDLNSAPCVETVTFSISKAFYGAEFLRVGMRMQRGDTDDGIDVFNAVEMVNRSSLCIAEALIDNYSVDYNWNTYKDTYLEICKEFELVPTDCIMFGLGNDKWNDYNRGTEVNRVCISEVIGDKIK